jgi:hypothetical protein
MDRSIPSIPCPVCEDPASNRTPPDFDGLIIRCDHCRDFEVSGTALSKLEKLVLLERIDVLRKAQQKAEPGRRAVITTACF